MNPSSTTAQDPRRQLRVKLLALTPGLLFALTLIPFGTTRITERPWLALAATTLGVALAWRAPGAQWPRWARLAAVATLLAWAWSALAFLPAGPELRAWLQPALAPLMDQALELVGGSSHPLALDPWRGLMEWSVGGAMLALAAGTAARVRTPEQTRWLLGLLVALGLGILLVAWAHRAQGAPFIWWVTGVPAFRREAFFAPFVSGNHAGATLAAIAPLAAALAMSGSSRARGLAALAGVGLIAGVVATGARAAFVDTAVALYLFALLILGPRARAVLVGLGALGVAVLPMVGVQRVLMWITAELAPRTYDAIEAGYSDVLTGRGDLYADSLRLLSAQPWFGVGSGGFDLAFRAFKTTPEYQVSTYAHQEPLQFAIEHGLPGLALVALAWLALVGGGAARAASGPLDELRVHRAALVASLVAVTVDCTVDFPLRIGSISTLVAVVAGALIGLSAEPGPARGWGLGLVSAPSLAGAAVALVLAFAPPDHALFAPARAAELAGDAELDAVRAVTDADARRAGVESALVHFEEAVARTPLQRTALQRLGRSAQYLRDLDRAERAFEIACEAYPTLPWVWLDLARVREQRGDVDGASEAWKHMLSNDMPDDPMRYVAEALNVEEDVHAAADAVLPERADRLVTAAVLADQRADPDEAERLLRRAMALNPRAGLELAGMLARWDRPADAANLLLKLEDSCRKSLLMGDVLVAQGQDQAAESMYEDALKRCGAKDRRARFGLGRVRLALGDARGLHALEALVKEDPSDRGALGALVRELERQGRLLEARRVQQLMVAPTAPSEQEAPIPER